MTPKTRWQQDLEMVQKQLAAARERAARQAAEQARAKRRPKADQRLFERAMADVIPLRADARITPPPSNPLPIPRQRQRDEQAALLESLSDEFDPGTLLATDELLSFRRRGIGSDVTTVLRGGKWAVQDQIDLHGMRRDQAREALGRFLCRAHAHGLRCVRVIHGKGLGSPGRVSILKTRVPGWLVQKRQVLAFVQATAPEGGAGALLVLLARAKAKADGE